MRTETKAIFPAHLDALSAINDFVTSAAEIAGLDGRAIYAVQMAAEEACVNIIEHAYGDEKEGIIECTCVVDGVGLTLTFCDYGIAFDPSSVAEPDLYCSLEDRKVGGLGLYLIRQMMDDVQFDCRPGVCNILKMVKYKHSAED